jgi:hypothetical protein
MRESLVGVATAATRQNAGTVMVAPLGRVSGPAGTAVADAMDTSGMVTAVSAGHGVPAAEAVRANPPSTHAMAPSRI